MRLILVVNSNVDHISHGVGATAIYWSTSRLWDLYPRPLGSVVSYVALWHVPLDFQQWLFSSIRSHAKSITANSISFSIPYSFENVLNWQREAFYDAIDSTKIVFVFDRGSSLDPGGAYNATFNPLGGRGRGMALPFFTQSTAFGVLQSRRLGSLRTKFWRRLCRRLI